MKLTCEEQSPQVIFLPAILQYKATRQCTGTAFTLVAHKMITVSFIDFNTDFRYNK